MERDKLKMNPLPQDQTPMLTPRLMAGVSFTVFTFIELFCNFINIRILGRILPSLLRRLLLWKETG